MKTKVQEKTLPERTAYRVGRRGIILLMYSVMFFLIGVKVLIAPAVDEGHFMFYTQIPIPIRLLLWMVPAVLGAYGALVRRGKNDAIGFAALCVPPAILVCSNLLSTVGFFLGFTHYSAGWVSALEWAIFLTILLVVSGWTEVKHQVSYLTYVEKDRT